MKTIKKYSASGKTHFKIIEEPVPIIQNPDDVLIKISHIGICSSDIHVLHGAMQMPDGNTVGHEFSGVVEETGSDVKKVQPGDKVICELAKGACKKCKMCNSGHYELCPEKQPPGWKSQGVYAEYTLQPEFCIHKIPQNTKMEVAAMAEPLAICIYGCIERGKICKNDFTVIYGMGSIGLFSLITLLDYGVENVICVTPTNKGKERLNLAKDLGASAVFSSHQNIEKEVLKLNKGWKADCVIDCSGSPQAINEGVNLLNKNGKFIALGITNDEQIQFNYNVAILNVIEMIFSATSSHQSWIKAIGIIKRNEEKIKKVVTHSFLLDQWEEAFKALSERKAIKAILYNV